MNDLIRHLEAEYEAGRTRPALLRAAIEALRTLQTKVDQLQAECWIPVSERLPDEGGLYLVVRDGGYCDIMIYDSVIRWFVIKDVTHWQPLPAGPATEAE